MLPSILKLHIKRFFWHGTRREKLKGKVLLPLQLEANTLFPVGAGPDAPKRWYDLTAVIVHEGRSIHSGHYKAYVRHSHSGEWLLANDARVTFVSQEEVMQAQGYLLFYAERSATQRAKAMLQSVPSTPAPFGLRAVATMPRGRRPVSPAEGIAEVAEPPAAMLAAASVSPPPPKQPKTARRTSQLDAVIEGGDFLLDEDEDEDEDAGKGEKRATTRGKRTGESEREDDSAGDPTHAVKDDVLRLGPVPARRRRSTRGASRAGTPTAAPLAAAAKSAAKPTPAAKEDATPTSGKATRVTRQRTTSETGSDISTASVTRSGRKRSSGPPESVKKAAPKEDAPNGRTLDGVPKKKRGRKSKAELARLTALDRELSLANRKAPLRRSSRQ